jgi:predicted amidophosphoribosyltransferase
VALVNCPECQKRISSKSDVCPGCGYSNQYVSCPECESIVLKIKNVCSDCGCPLGIVRSQGQVVESALRNAPSISEAWSSGTMVCFIVLGVLMPIAGLVVGVYGLTKDGKGGQGALILGISISSWILCVLIIF